MNALSACLLLLGLGLSSNRSTEAPPPVSACHGSDYTELYGIVADDRNSCGPSALYVFLRLHGKAVRLSEIEKATVRQPDGQVSFFAMRRSSGEARVSSSDRGSRRQANRKVSISGCRVSGTCQRIQGPNDALGHFVVVLEVRDGKARYIDGSSCTIHTKSAGYLARRRRNGLLS